MSKCCMCKEEEVVTYMGLIGEVCKTCLRTKIWSYYSYTEEDIEDYLKREKENPTSWA